MRTVFLLPFAILFVFLSAAFCRALCVEWSILCGEWNRFLFVGIGVAIYIVSRFFLFLAHRNLEFLETFCHELNHTVFALLSFRRIESFFAHAEKGGRVTFRGSPNPVIALAPYAFPLFAFCAAMLSLVLIPRAREVVQVVVGFFLAFHLGYVVRDAHPGQTDLQLYGYPFSYSAIAFFNLFWIFFVLEIGTCGLRGGLAWVKTGFGFAWDWIVSFGRFLWNGSF